jgi:hypothetical protein
MAIDRLLQRRGVMATSEESGGADRWADEAPVLAGLAAAQPSTCSRPGQSAEAGADQRADATSATNAGLGFVITNDWRPEKAAGHTQWCWLGVSSFEGHPV